MVEFVTLTRKAASEAIGTAFLLATVIGSGIMGEWPRLILCLASRFFQFRPTREAARRRHSASLSRPLGFSLSFGG